MKNPLPYKSIINLVFLTVLCSPCVSQEIQSQNHEIIYQLTPENVQDNWVFEIGRVNNKGALKNNLKNVLADETQHVSFVSAENEYDHVGDTTFRCPKTGQLALQIGDGAVAGGMGCRATGTFIGEVAGTAVHFMTMAHADDPSHGGQSNPFISYKIYIDGQLLPCGTYTVNQASIGDDWRSSLYARQTTPVKGKGRKKNRDTESELLYPFVRDWTELTVMLEYGSVLTCVIEVGDCSFLAHSSTLWLSAFIELQEIEVEGELSCANVDGVTLAAPGGAEAYRWSNGMSGRTVIVHTPGEIFVEMESASKCVSYSQTTVPEYNLAKRDTTSRITMSGQLTCKKGSQPVELFVETDSIATWTWSNGTSNSSLKVNSPQDVEVKIHYSGARSVCDNVIVQPVKTSYVFPDIEFSLEDSITCAGSSVAVEFTPVPKRHKNHLVETWDWGVVAPREAGETPVYSNVGEIKITRKLIRKPCQVEHVERLSVKPLIRPKVSIDVDCLSINKSHRIESETLGLDSIDIEILDVDDNTILRTSESIFNVILPEGQSYNLNLYARSNYGCEQRDTVIQYIPNDPLPLHTTWLRSGTPDEIRFTLKDSSLFVVDKKLDYDLGTLLFAEDQSTFDWLLEDYSSAQMNLTLVASPLACDVEIPCRIAPRIPLSQRFFEQKYTPVEPLPTTVFDCN